MGGAFLFDRGIIGPTRRWPPTSQGKGHAGEAPARPVRDELSAYQVNLSRIDIERPMELLNRGFRKVTACPGATLAPELMVRAGTSPRLMVLSALNISTRYSKALRSLILKRFAIERFSVLVAFPRNVLRPTVRA